MEKYWINLDEGYFQRVAEYSKEEPSKPSFFFIPRTFSFSPVKYNIFKALWFTINENMKTLHPFVSLWVNPRETIQQLAMTSSPHREAFLVSCLSLGYLIQVALLIFMIDVIPGSIFFSSKGLLGLVWCFLALAIAAYAYVHLTSLMIRPIAKWLRGKATITTTRLTLLWCLLSYLPLGFSILLIYFAYQHKLIGKPIFLLDIISLIVFFILFIQSFILMLKMLSAINHFSIWRAFLTLLLCAMIQGGIIFTLIKAI